MITCLLRTLTFSVFPARRKDLSLEFSFYVYAHRITDSIHAYSRSYRGTLGSSQVFERYTTEQRSVNIRSAEIETFSLDLVFDGASSFYPRVFNFHFLPNLTLSLRLLWDFGSANRQTRTLNPSD